MAAGESGPLITLSGETDITTVPQLSEVITGQLATGTRHLTIDASELTYADSASLQVLFTAARTLTRRGGGLVLLRPHYTVARVLTLIGADQMITIRGQAEATPRPHADRSGNPALKPSDS